MADRAFLYRPDGDAPNPEVLLPQVLELLQQRARADKRGVNGTDENVQRGVPSRGSGRSRSKRYEDPSLSTRPTRHQMWRAPSLCARVM